MNECVRVCAYVCVYVYRQFKSFLLSQRKIETLTNKWFELNNNLILQKKNNQKHYRMAM